MKKAFLMVLACLLLAGCGAPTGTTAKVPETAPEEPISAPAVVTEGRVPEEYDALPTEVVSLYDWQTSGEPLALLAEIPEQEMALYGVADRDAPHVLFRWGDTLAEFPDWVIYTPKSVTPELLALDLDGDGAVEPVVSCFQGGNQVSRYALHVLQQSRGTLTDSQLPDSLYEEQLSALLTLSGSGEMLTISLGSQSIEAALPERGAGGDSGTPVDRSFCLLVGRWGRPLAGGSARAVPREFRPRLRSQYGRPLRPGLPLRRPVHPFGYDPAIQTFLSFSRKERYLWKRALPSPMNTGTTCM